MNSRDYWAEREAEALKHYIKEEAEYDKQIQKIYADMLDDIQTQINSFYGKYAAKEGITLAEAKKRVKQLDIEAYERKAKRYVKDKDFSAKANEEMRLYNATMKINRLEMLKANIGLETISGHNELEKFMSKILRGRTEAELARQAGILGKTIHGNSKLAHAIPNASFHSGTFSDRIWQYQDLMRGDLEKLLTRGLIQGKNARALTADLRKYLIGDKNGKGATYNVERLMRTELARVQTEAQKQSYIRNGFTQYKFHVNGGCCDICEGIKGKVFDVEKMMPGENAPPMHPHCRCSTSAYSDRKEYDEWLDFLEKGGTTEEYNKLKGKSTLTNVSKGAIISGAFTGALNNKNDPEGKKRETHAEQYYSAMRNSAESDIVSAISDNAEIDADLVSKMYNHLILNKYNLEEGYSRFAPDYDIAESIRRLREGKSVQEHDLLLVYHEALEYDLMNEKGLNYEEAHEIANKSYNYQEALYKWLDENER